MRVKRLGKSHYKPIKEIRIYEDDNFLIAGLLSYRNTSQQF